MPTGAPTSAPFYVAIVAASCCCSLLAAAAANEEPDPPSYDWPAFTNWDCVGVNGKADWDMLYRHVVAGIRGELNQRGVASSVAVEGASERATPEFVLPEVAIELLQGHAVEAREECPLGTLYFLTLYTYEMVLEKSTGGGMAVRQAETLVQELRRYPFFIIAASRWPTFELLSHFSYFHRPQNPKAMATTLCMGVRGDSGVDWDSVQAAAQSWSDDQLRGLEPGQGNPEDGRILKEAADAIYKDSAGRGASAQMECPFGFLFLCTTQVLAAAMRLTGAFEAWCRALDKMLSELPFFGIAGSGWPTYRMLAFFSGLSKGSELPILEGFQADVHRWGNTHPQTKRFRQYGDLRLGAVELRGPWGGPAEADNLAELDVKSWFATLSRQKLVPKPVLVEALEAVASVVQAAALPRQRECGFSGITPDICRGRGCHWAEEPPPRGGPQCQRPAPKRKVVGVTFVWGERWAFLVPRFVAWASRLRLAVVVVAMGDACRGACEVAVAALGGGASSGVACWDPLRNDAEAAMAVGPGQDKRRAERGSILQRHAMVHLLLHLGVDALAFDFDTFFFGDPRPKLEAIANEASADVLMTRHLDADCLNMGLLYIRASSRSAEWYGRYLDWLHQHPYEREQRGANALLNFTRQSVSFPPKHLPPLNVTSLDDSNEFASSRGGWLGDWSKLVFFHWVNPMETQVHWSDIKVTDLGALYEATLHPSTDLDAAGGSLSSLLADATPGTPWHSARQIMQSMQVPQLPERRPCW